MQCILSRKLDAPRTLPNCRQSPSSRPHFMPFKDIPGPLLLSAHNYGLPRGSPLLDNPYTSKPRPFQIYPENIKYRDAAVIVDEALVVIRIKSGANIKDIECVVVVARVGFVEIGDYLLYVCMDAVGELDLLVPF